MSVSNRDWHTFVMLASVGVLCLLTSNQQNLFAFPFGECVLVGMGVDGDFGFDVLEHGDEFIDAWCAVYAIRYRDCGV